MHILMVSDVYFPRINGVSTSIQTFAEAFVELGHRLTLIAPRYPTDFSPAFDVLRVTSIRLPFDPEDRLMSLRAIKRLVPHLRQLDIDIVHIQTPFVAHYAGIHIAHALGLPVIASYHTFFEAYFEKYLPWLPNGWLRAIARRYSYRQCNEVDAVVSPSHPMRDKLREYGIKQPIAVIPTGLPPQSFGRIATNRFRERHGLEADAFVLLYVGRVAHEKNIDFLITMFQRLPERAKTAVLLIAGEGPALGALRARALASPDGDRILFVGYLDRETELLACYQTSDVFVFASETETQGLVLLEAMASGLPVVSTARMGTRDVLVDGEGCVVSPLDADAFAERVMRLYDSPAQRALLSGSAVAYARCWASDAKAFEMVSCYERTLQAEAGEPGKTMDATSVRADVKAE